ncbi:MAG: hypothetical protein KJO38_08435 [Gammaproteobacteria bacterium]|nr:hypothetical protein [Gammaproteobacteria bacterium]
MAPDILKRIEADYGAAALEQVAAMLGGYSGNEADRVRRCIMYLADGDIEALKTNLATARQDYRDIILFAEYDHADIRVRNFDNVFS